MNLEIIIPEQYEKLLTEKAEEQEIPVGELVARILRNYMERNNNQNGN